MKPRLGAAIAFPRIFIQFFLPFYLFFNAFLFILGLINNNMEYISLSFFIGTPFVIGVLYSLYSKSKLVITFSLFALLSAWLGPLAFFLEQGIYTFDGFSAVKHFDFSSVVMINYYKPIIFSYFIILLIGAIPKTKPKLQYENATREKKTSQRLQNKSSYLIYILLILFAFMNYHMFNHSIGITGISPTVLPFKLSGIAYYFSRFIIPLILVFYFTKYKLEKTALSAVMIYALWAALSSASRLNLITVFFPIFISGFIYRTYIFSMFSVGILFIFYSIVGFSRDYIYAESEGVSIRNTNFSFFEVVSNSIVYFDYNNIFIAPLAVIGRIGGGQDVVLASQYSNKEIAGAFQEFLRLYIYDFGNITQEAQALMYNFSFLVDGYSPGDGGFFARILLVGDSSYFNIAIVSIFLGIILAIGNIIYLDFREQGVPKSVQVFYCVIFTCFFFVFSISLWLNIFIISMLLISKSKIYSLFLVWKNKTKLLVR